MGLFLERRTTVSGSQTVLRSGLGADTVSAGKAQPNNAVSRAAKKLP